MIDWSYFSACVTGASHDKLGTVCQDAVRCASEDGWFFAAVSDGAGSAKRAEEGSCLVVENTCLAFFECIGTGRRDVLEAIQHSVQAAREAIAAKAEESGSPLRDFAATLLVVAFGPSGGASAQIGDGVIAIRQANTTWGWVFWPQRGEYANVTRFITDEDALETIEYSRLSPEVIETALMTDGLEPLALHYESRTLHAPFFEGMMTELRGQPLAGERQLLSDRLKAFLGSQRVRERADDDLTLVMARRLTEK
ncbi:MAG: protein phosphatase 2C domain-containing protein [Alphaproteobacteria bacterium]|nr:protein phosphatase 2C domain-containing protein [Alphaproteobacteria bacterium]MBL7098325.1 protein phosphatase 2C domain-containing protein [Alphaproteobacteria bacterium]